MIKIDHPNLSRIVSLHSEACIGYVTPRVDFCIALFNALGYRNYYSNISTLRKEFNIEANTVKSIVKPFIKKKGTKISIVDIKRAVCTSNDNAFVTRSQRTYYQTLYEFFSNVKISLIEFTKADPMNLSLLSNHAKFNLQNDERLRGCLKYIFNYTAFVNGDFKLKNGDSWDNYSLTKALDISVCPYCNRNWIVTVKKNSAKLTNPQLDHFFSQTDYPLLRLSFFNLIPSCETCNSRLKGEIKFSIDTHLHPYVEGYEKDGVFRTISMDYESSVGLSSNYNVLLETLDLQSPNKVNKIRENHQIFEINEIYKAHGDVISELYRKKNISNDKYLDILSRQYSEANLSKEELYRLAFGNYFNEKEFKKRPFAKLTKDIAEQLSLIKPDENC